MLMNQTMTLVEKYVQEIQEAEPEKREHFEKIILSLLDVTMDLLKRSPEFRQGFAKIHSDFLDYPESHQTVEKAVIAYNRYNPQNH